MIHLIYRLEPEDTEDSISVIVQGSVWKAWDILKDNFEKSVKNAKIQKNNIREIRMVRLPDHAGGLGAARLARLHFSGYSDDFSKSCLASGEVMDKINFI